MHPLILHQMAAERIKDQRAAADYAGPRQPDEISHRTAGPAPDHIWAACLALTAESRTGR
jgi:hypothetical protein